MSKIDKDNLGYLGADFQVRLMAHLLVDNQFATSIIDIIDANYFEDTYLRIIGGAIKDAYEKYEIIPDTGSLEARLLESVRDEVQRKYVVSQLRKVQEANLNDALWVQETAMKFCKQQELKKSVNLINKIIEKGDLDDYEKCEDILRKALDVGYTKDNGINVCDNLDKVLADDFRNPIRTGINGLDDVMEGGLSKGELAIILAPFGVGKTTMMTKIANTAKDDGNNVLQIFFEDKPEQIQRKHFACWSGYKLTDLSLYKDELKEIAAKKNGEKGVLKLKHFPSVGTTIPTIKAYIKKCIASGFKPDVIILDYIDCVTPSTHYDDTNVGEGMVMRQFENMLTEFDMAGWTAVQGNRESIGANVVQAGQMAGSIKKGMIGHFIVSIAKTLDQKEANTATMAILKSRFGKDGIIFDDITFDNSTIHIDMGKNKGPKTHGEHKQGIAEDNQNRVNLLLKAVQDRKNTVNTVIVPNTGGPDQITQQ